MKQETVKSPDLIITSANNFPSGHVIDVTYHCRFCNKRIDRDADAYWKRNPYPSHTYRKTVTYYSPFCTIECYVADAI